MRSIDTSVPHGPSARAPQVPRDDRRSLQRLSRDLGNRGFGRLVAGARADGSLLPGRPGDAGTAAVSQGAAALARAVSARAGSAGREGKSRSANELETEEIEGHDRLAALQRGRAIAMRRLQRMTITQVSSDSDLRTGTCGERNVQWIFSLDKPAPEDGYIVQHVEGSEEVKACPGPLTGTMRKTHNFWEAWPVKAGDLVDWTTTRDGWTDGSTRPPRPNRVGVQVSDGTVKFFGRSKTGDLGDFDKAPADATSPWGPGRVPTSGALPSTATKPSWWDDASVEKTAVRQARSEWNCCDADPSKHTSRVTAYPPRPSRCEVKDWF